MDTIAREELKRRLDAGEDITVVEALPASYYGPEHLPGAINIPHDAVREQAPELIPDKAAMVVVYCANTRCANSRIAAETLDAMGYKRVFEYVEGKADWKEAGYPTEGHAAVPA